MTPVLRALLLIAVIVLIGGGIFVLERTKPMKATTGGEVSPRSIVFQPRFEKTPGEAASSPSAATSQEEKKKRFLLAKEIVSPHGFINTAPFTIGNAVGKKVILVDFWTYSCINCQRTIPYLNAWWEKYKDQGLLIIGVHTPEFEFEKVEENVRRAVEKFGITYPVVLDNDYATWNAYQNRYWPRKYLIDIDGFVVYDHIGEGAYAQTERKIQEALAERALVFNESANIARDIAEPSGTEAVDASKPISPEIYFGSDRNVYLRGGQGGVPGPQTMPEPTEIKPGILYLAGEWYFTPQFAENSAPGGKIIFRYKGKKVFFVASGIDQKEGSSIRVLRDGKPLGKEAGGDIMGGMSKALITQDRLYRLIEDEEYGEHTLEIIIEKPYIKAFTFTFG